eukprot:TRINITY_DN67204_c0_g1_i1.p1 TRINITY_DN67204_c0_g1~~TRINITY_DN67204_c0_g1_i1.p1  ORF type:complete len:475 (+),score=175.94 TRINITY_DN67204_c0_g1_i1:53-1477(+)
MGLLEGLAQTVPLRLTPEERSLQRLLASALDVSEYTNKVEATSRYRHDVILAQLYELYQIMLGLNINASANKGKKMLVDMFKQGSSKEAALATKECQAWLAKVFEIGRRYKRMNPDKMRTEYGKLITIMQDAVDQQGCMRINVKIPVMTVDAVLERHGLEGLLSDPELEVAAKPVAASADGVQESVREKEAKIKELAERHGAGDAEKRDVVELAIRSLDDGACVLRDNAEILTSMMGLLEEYFHPKTGKQVGNPHGDISIAAARGGSKLTHSHTQHYFYVLESLTLWRCIMKNIFSLWSIAEEDMLDSQTSYRRRNTGQGVHRVKSAPLTYRAMHQHIASASEEMRERGSSWIGTKIVHLGDDDVPNALVFIDKYTQVPRMIAPILKVIESIDRVAELPGQREYLESKFGSIERCKAEILQDFFKYGFDGSGSDGGSCIDGRLTSAWNWCSKLDKKPFHHVFLLCGFQGFDGQW